MRLDSGTLLFITALFAGLFSAIFVAMRSTVRAPVGGLREWAIAYALFALALAAFLFSGHAPELVTTVFARTAAVAGFGFVYAGVRAFNGRPLRWLAFGVWVIAMLALFSAFTWVVDSARARIVIAMVAESLVYLATIRELAPRHEDRLHRAALMFTVGGMTLAALAALLRAAATIISPDEPALFAYSGVHVAYVAVHALVAVAVGLGFVMLAHLRLRAQLQFLASHDSLTHAYTHRVFLELCARELARSERDRTPIALLMLDLDHFKRVNDTFGHVAGDRVLAGTAALLRSTLRGHDLLGRYGGEEFAVLLPGVGGDEAMAIAERTRARIAATDLGTATVPIRITVSIGVAVATDGRSGVEDLVAVADRLLYESKRAGRNRVHGPQPVRADPDVGNGFAARAGA
jgi:diguanylate cyclase (GGDEF)-like protein